ncbi:MAG: hypothetical protein ACOWWO_15700 [Peptococcaceae bacterium]
MTIAVLLDIIFMDPYFRVVIDLFYLARTNTHQGASRFAFDMYTAIADDIKEAWKEVC